MNIKRVENSLPNLVLAGAAKSGTTSLHSCLAQHPDIYMCEPKEPNFFSHENKYVEGINRYAELFTGGSKHAIRGESSVSYMLSSKAIDRMKLSLENTKYIFLLRNPIDRAYSHYWWLRGTGFEEDTNFESAFKRDMAKKDEEVLFNVKRDIYYRGSCYGKYISRYVHAFGRENILFVTMEHFKKDPLGLVNTCCDFLGLEPLDTLETMNKNKTVQLKHPKLYQSLWFAGQTMPARLIKKLIPHGVNKQLRKIRKNLLSRVGSKVESQAYSRLTQEQRLWLADVYRDDVALLRKLSGESFDEWHVDFPNG